MIFTSLFYRPQLQKMELPSVTTAAGDNGTSTLVGGKRIRKDDPVFEFLGTIDELNSLLGVCNCYAQEDVKEQIQTIQNKLFELSGCIACDKPASDELKGFVKILEEWGCELDKKLPELHSFILPGGHVSASFMHLARTVCRRAERCGVHALPDRTDFCQFLNRLSDYLFLLARFHNVANGVEEIKYV